MSRSATCPENRRDELAEADGDGDGPGDFVAEFAPAQPPFDAEKGNATDEQSPGDWREFFRQFEAFFVNDETAGAGEGEGGENFQQVIPGFLFAPFEDEFMEPVRKKREHGDDRAALDDDVEEVGLARQPMLRAEQMAGG